jgi:predicted permease
MLHQHRKRESGFEMRLSKKLRAVYRRARFYFHQPEFDRELEAEMRFHLDMKAAAKEQQGMPAESARLEARRQFGNLTLIHERSRDMWAFRWLETLAQDLRYAVRMIAKSPGLSSVVVLSMALAIGANTAIFSLVDAVLLKTLPVKNPQELVLLGWASPAQGGSAVDSHSGSIAPDPATGQRVGSSLTSREFDRMREANQTLSDLFAFAPIYNQLNVSADGQSSVSTGQYVSGGYYKGLGVQAVLGRTITDGDDEQGAEPVAVVTYDYWKKRFASDPGVIGRPVNINGLPFSIIGVTPPKFQGALSVGETAEVSVPLASQPLVDRQPSLAAQPSQWWLRVMGRLKPGATIEQVRANLEGPFQQSAMEGHQEYLAIHPDPRRNDASAPVLTGVSGSPGEMWGRKQYGQQLFVLLVIVGLVLLIACVNTANLLLARSGARGKEIAVRIAVGAGRLRLIRQLLTESLTLAAVGGLAGFIFANWLKNALIPALPWREGALTLDTRLDLRVLAFTAATSVATGIIFGIAPALRATRIDPGPVLKDNAANQSSGRSRLRLGKTLVVVQVALSLLLLVGAGLFVRTLRNLQQVDTGFDPDNLLLFEINPSLNGYKGEAVAGLYQQVSQRLKAVPGVKSIAMSQFALLKGWEWSTEGIKVVGAQTQPDEDKGTDLLAVGANFLETMRIPLLHGRGLEASDAGATAKVAVVSASFAKRFFPDQDPVGHSINWEGNKSGEIQIVGVAGDIRYDGLRNDAPAIAYLPFLQQIAELDSQGGGMTFEVRTIGDGDPDALAPAIRDTVRSIDSNLPIFDIKTQRGQIDESLGNERLFATFTGVLGALALLLACMGLYGVMSYNVSRRSGEIGIRMALGADAGKLLRQVMFETMGVVVIGTAFGVAASLAATRVISSQWFGVGGGDSGLLFGITAHDPVVIGLAAFFLLAVSAVAGLVPARRASRIDPLIALRCE